MVPLGGFESGIHLCIETRPHSKYQKNKIKEYTIYASFSYLKID
jgi:hypothetical protein